MDKHASFWPNERFLHGELGIPKHNDGEEPTTLEYRCMLSPHITNENKDAIIQSVMNQFQILDMNPNIVAPQDSNYFTITVDNGKLKPVEIRNRLETNYFIDKAASPTDKKVVRNYHFQIPGVTASAPNELTQSIINLSKNNPEFSSDFGKEKIQWIPIGISHSIREFDRDGEDAYDESRNKIDSLKESLPRIGFTDPMIATYSQKDRHVYLSEGNHRLIAAQELGLTHVPVRIVRNRDFEVKDRGNAKQVPGIEPNIHDYIPGDMNPSQIGLVDEKDVIKNASVEQLLDTVLGSVGGQGYDAPVTSYLDAPGAQDPEGPQYIIDQQNITGPQIEASIKTAGWWTAHEDGGIDPASLHDHGFYNHLVGELGDDYDEMRSKVDDMWGDGPADVTDEHLDALLRVKPDATEAEAQKAIRSNPNWASDVTQHFMDKEFGPGRAPNEKELDKGIRFSVNQNMIDYGPTSGTPSKRMKASMAWYKNYFDKEDKS